jgi:hypothetical protein
MNQPSGHSKLLTLEQLVLIIGNLSSNCGSARLTTTRPW